MWSPLLFIHFQSVFMPLYQNAKVQRMAWVLETGFQPRLSDCSVCGLNLDTWVPPRKKEKWSWPHVQLSRQNIKMYLWIYGPIGKCIEKDGAKYTASFTGFPLKCLGTESIWTLGFLHFWSFLKACWEPTGGVEVLSYWVSLVWPQVGHVSAIVVLECWQVSGRGLGSVFL